MESNHKSQNMTPATSFPQTHGKLIMVTHTQKFQQELHCSRQGAGLLRKVTTLNASSQLSLSSDLIYWFLYS